MNSNVKVIERPLRGGAGYTLDVDKGTFIITKNSRSTLLTIDISIIDFDESDRHALLNITTAGNKSLVKDKWLCGHDERDWFVGAIPNASAKNIIEAKQSLKPAVVLQIEKALPNKKKQKRKNKARIRQGEWFFIPAPDLIPDEKMIHKNEPISRGQGSKFHYIEEVYRTGGATVYVSTAHPSGVNEAEYKKIIASNSSEKFRRMTKNAVVFARGKVKHADHATIVLDGWHKVIMNTENQASHRKNLVFLD